MRSGRPMVPWSLSEARTTFLALVAGAGMLMGAWWASSGSAKLNHQTTWTIVGILAVVLIGAGNLYWVASGRRAVRLRRNEVVESLEELLLLAPSASGSQSPISGRFVVLPDSMRYHREGCLLVRGKQADPLPTRAGALDGLWPCEMCEP